eukprot:scaffold2097_cov403-Prasinococcus_capsulatus_cf.AAC.10
MWNDGSPLSVSGIGSWLAISRTAARQQSSGPNRFASVTLLSSSGSTYDREGQGCSPSCSEGQEYVSFNGWNYLVQRLETCNQARVVYPVRDSTKSSLCKVCEGLDLFGVTDVAGHPEYTVAAVGVAL